MSGEAQSGAEGGSTIGSLLRRATRRAAGAVLGRIAPTWWYETELLHEASVACRKVRGAPRDISLLRLLRTRPAREPAGEVFDGPWNRPLRRHSEVEAALGHLCRLGLPPHPDGPKNWDAFLAFSWIVRHAPADAAVLDLGASPYGRILPWLQLYGLRDLHGCDLVFDQPVRRGRIHYTPQDIQATDYPDRRFDVLTCLSVVEHGVDPRRLFSEAARILRPGGALLLSTDYWEEPIDTDGLHDELYDCPVVVFSRQGAESLLATAEELGFRPVDPPSLGCEERVVHWERHGLRYTFLFLALRLEQNAGR